MAIVYKDIKKKKTITSVIVLIVLACLCVVGVFQAGIIGVFINNIYSYIFGIFGILFLVYTTIVLIIFAFDREYIIWSKIGRSIILLNIFILLLVARIHYSVIIDSINELSFIEQLNKINFNSEELASGALGFSFICIFYSLFGFIGVDIILSIIMILFLLNSFDLKQWYFNTKLHFETRTKFDVDEEFEENEVIENLDNNSKTINLFDKFELFKSKDKQIIDPIHGKLEYDPLGTKKNTDHVLLLEDPLFPGIISYEKKETKNSTPPTNLLEKEDSDILVVMQKPDKVRIKPLIVSNIDGYEIPSLELLNPYGDNSKQLEKLKKVAIEKAEVLKMALESFNLSVEILNIHIGPNVTKYELQPERGTKVSKFASLSNDIAMALASNGVRIEAPIPGKSCVGIEIANSESMFVSLKEILESTNNKIEDKLQIGLGKDISGQSIFSHINKTPHLLVAGSTGSGKSVCINSIIVSILTKATPKEVKLIMIDPKKVELTPYNGIPHLLTPVVTDPKKASIILNKMVQEMETRYEIFAETNTRNIEGFNKKIKTSDDSYSSLPYIVIIVDELADLMMVASKEVETSIARLAQMARAAGIHLIIATQRPSTDVITGLIKANIPSRIAFAVSSAIDSRTILDSGGAEKLLGRGDMLYSEAGSNNLKRIQGAFLSDEEIEAIVSRITSQYTEDEVKENYDDELVNIEITSSISELDELYQEVCADVLSTQKASTAFIQRKYKVGYNRACRIMDQLEEQGIVGPNDGPKPRKVLKGN